MANITSFLKNIMNNNFTKDEDEKYVKYTNNNYKVIQKKNKNIDKDLFLIFDNNKKIIYNDIKIAYTNIK